MKQAAFYLTFFIGAIALGSCKKSLNVEVTKQNVNVLVVEGFINTIDSTKITLSRTVIIANKIAANPELNAQVTLENATGTVATLQHLGKGVYATQSLILDNTKQYRVRIKTSNGKTYLSDLTNAKVTQPIDDVGYDATNAGISIYANTHDATNNSRYYLYNYEETWEFRTKFISAYRTNGSAIIPRTKAEYIDHCFGFQASNNIIVNSTAALVKDVAFKAPIATVASTSEKLGIKYSILVTQIALTKEAYAFWDNMRKNTEGLGSIFDAQPSEISGNIHNVADAAEPVIGYISAGTKQSKRIFIKNADLPSSYKFEYPYDCKLDSSYLFFPPKGKLTVATMVVPLTSPYLAADAIWSEEPIPAIIGYQYSGRPCLDCTIRGRVQQPSFWQ
ncbi:DUF4249 domain-containing protein [Mucilaginibacter calamicampi]|uniref:DUF4249 domain-containing protein n=1 Tax=Mucilaginibacter calamicampi TaxID=1302352 RepID=A0ABW2YYB3_9SPHI